LEARVDERPDRLEVAWWYTELVRVVEKKRKNEKI